MAWANLIAALVIAAVAVKEGREPWEGDTCCTPTLSAPTDTTVTADTDDTADTAIESGCVDGCGAPTDHETADRP